jgi:Transposase DDE domain group 1
MESSHVLGAVDVAFDEDNLLADAGLVQVVALAEAIGLAGLVGDRVKITGADNAAGANPGAKVMSLIAAMGAGADSISDCDRLRVGAMDTAFTGVRAPSTLGTFLRSFTHGHVRQLESVHREVLARMGRSMALLPGGEQIAYLDVDSTHRRVYGYAKQGAAVGRLKGKKTLHPLAAAVSTPLCAPVVTGCRMRRGRAADVRGADSFLAESLNTARAAGATGMIIVRGDSKFYTADVAATAARHGAHLSVTVPANAHRDAAIAAIDKDAWTPIHYPEAFVDTDTGELVSDAQVAQISYTAFTSRPQGDQVQGRLIVRRVKRLNPRGDHAQGTLFDTWRHHAVFVTHDLVMLEAEKIHRGHAIVEQVFADASASALAHLPSGNFNANAAWALLWAITHNLTRALGVLSATSLARATTSTIRRELINIPARLARSARRLLVHLPRNWPAQEALTLLHTAISAITATARPPTVNP